MCARARTRACVTHIYTAARSTSELAVYTWELAVYTWELAVHSCTILIDLLVSGFLHSLNFLKSVNAERKIIDKAAIMSDIESVKAVPVTSPRNPALECQGR